MITADSKIFIAGHRGMVGAALARYAQASGYKNIITRSHQQLNLTDPSEVNRFFDQESPDVVLLAAAKVGGIKANNTYPANFIYENLMIEANVVQAAWRYGTQRLLLFGSSCIYPKHACQPIREDALLTGTLEPTNEPYAIAKIAGIKLCESYNRQYGTDFRTVMPANLYGPGDSFGLENSHVIPALIRKFHDAKITHAPDVIVWGSGNVKREFMHSDDMADASWHILMLDKEIYEKYTLPMRSYINIGTGTDVKISKLAKIVREVVGYDGEIIYDTSKPDGAPRKLLDITNLKMIGWQSRIALKKGLHDTYQWFLNNLQNARGA